MLTFARNSEAQLKQSSFIEEFTSVTSVDDGIEGVTEIQAACTQYSSSLIIEQLKLAHTVDDKSGDKMEVMNSVFYRQMESHMMLF